MYSKKRFGLDEITLNQLNSEKAVCWALLFRLSTDGEEDFTEEELIGLNRQVGQSETMEDLNIAIEALRTRVGTKYDAVRDHMNCRPSRPHIVLQRGGHKKSM